MDLGLQGKSALVLASSAGLGRAIAVAFAREGADVTLFARRAAECRAVQAEIKSATGRDAHVVTGDLTKAADIQAAVDGAVGRFGRLDILVNNASTFYPTPVGEITPAHWDDLMGTNLKAPLFLSQAAAPLLAVQGGLILNMVDIHGQRPLKRHPVYCPAKAGLIMLTRSLARELGPRVRVNGIAPGPVMWPEGEIDAALKAKIVERTALKRTGSAEDIARAALFFAAEAPYVTGQILAVDGGRSLGGGA